MSRVPYMLHNLAFYVTSHYITISSWSLDATLDDEINKKLHNQNLNKQIKKKEK